MTLCVRAQRITRFCSNSLRMAQDRSHTRYPLFATLDRPVLRQRPHVKGVVSREVLVELLTDGVIGTTVAQSPKSRSGYRSVTDESCQRVPFSCSSLNGVTARLLSVRMLAAYNACCQYSTTPPHISQEELNSKPVTELFARRASFQVMPRNKSL